MRHIVFLIFVSMAGFTFAQNAVQEGENNRTSNSDFKIGYSGSIEAGYDIGIISFWSPGFGMDREKIEIINGLRLTPFISLGVGTGLHYYFDFDNKKTWVPIFINMKVNFTEKRLSPILSLRGGYSFDFKNNFENIGFLVNSFIGVKYKIWSKFSLNAGVGLEIQKIECFLWNEPAYFNAMTLNIGLSFN